MSESRNYEKKAEILINPILKEYNFEMVDVEYIKEAGNWYLRIYIDKEGGITIDDCEKVSRGFGELLDQEDFIKDSYILEVSSPGLGRQLKKEKDFERSIGEEVEVKLYKAMKVQNENGKEISIKELTGILEGFDKDKITITLESKETFVLPKKEIAMVKLAFNF